MLLPRKQILKFLRLNRKFKTSPDYFKANYKNIIKETKYFLEPRYVLCSIMKRTNRKLFLKFNHLKITGDRRKPLPKKRIDPTKSFPKILKNKKCRKHHRVLVMNQRIRKLSVITNKANIETVEIDDDDDDDIVIIEPEKELSNVIIQSQSKQPTEAKVSSENVISIKENQPTNCSTDNNDIKQSEPEKLPDKCIKPDKCNKPETVISEKQTELPESATSSESSSDSEDDDDDKDSSSEESESEIIEKENEKSTQETQDVSKKLREQIKLLQSGKRNITLLTAGKNSFADKSSVASSKESSRCVSPSFSRHASHSSIDDTNSTTNDILNKSADNSIVAVTPKLAVSDKSTNENTSTPIGDRKRFLDLLNKINTSTNKVTDKNSNTLKVSIPISTSTPKSNTITLKSIKDSIEKNNENENKTITIADNSDNDSNDSSQNDFLGFRDNDDLPTDVHSLLPTPIVKKATPAKNIHSAFVSEKCDALMKELAIETSDSNLPIIPAKKFVDEALVSQETIPPTLSCPKLPTSIEKPRTVAEKRQLLMRKKKNIKYLMIENESTISRELSKRSKYPDNVNYDMTKTIQDIDIPFTRDCWRATCWLNTKIGNFYYQTVEYNRNPIKIISGKGDNDTKIISEICTKSPIKYSHYRKPINAGECSEKCLIDQSLKFGGLNLLPKIKIEKISPQNSPSKKTKLNPYTERSLITCGPLSRKQLKRSSVDIELGPLELYNMPLIQLEVWPEIDKPLPDIVRPYLKIALPHDCITDNWAKFAVSTLFVKPPVKRNSRKRKVIKPVKIDPEPFTFDVPYLNNQDKILVRKRKSIISPVNNVDDLLGIDDKPFKFMKNVDRNNDVDVEVATILGKMINSVAISLSENTFICKERIQRKCLRRKVKQQPNRKTVTVIEPEVSTETNDIDERKRSKIRKELKRLNATIIDTSYPTMKLEKCDKEYCDLGCICESLSVPKYFAQHCKNINCMLECNCPTGGDMNINMKEMRDRATACLAKEEKEFTSTVVLSNDKTIHLSNNANTGKRNKKLPKRFDDCIRIMDNSKSIKFISDCGSSEPIIVSKIRGSDTLPNQTNIQNQLSDIQLTQIVSMGHVSVTIDRLDDTFQLLEPWCMVHSLYKCFCKLNATTGKPFNFIDDTDDMINSFVEQSSSTITPATVSKVKATGAKATVAADNTLSDLAEKNNSPLKITLKRRKTSDRDEFDVTQSSTNKEIINELQQQYDTCRRARPVSAQVMLKRNRRRAPKIREYLKKREENHPQFRVFLMNRVKRCLMIDAPLTIVENNSASISPEPSSSAMIAPKSKQSATAPPEVTTINDTTIDKPPPKKIPKMQIKLNKNSLLKNDHIAITLPETPQKSSVNSSLNETNDNNSQTPSINDESLANKKDITPSASFMLNDDEIKKPSKIVSDIDKRKQLANVNKLNLIVTRTMQSMCNIQRNQLRKISPPIVKTLTSLQWSNLTQMFNNDEIYVWKVQLENDDLLLVATLQKTMPIIPNTMCVVNIKSAASNPLPVLAQLLKGGKTNSKTDHLAVLMFGAERYWRILGCIHSQHEYLNAGIQAKPTPKTHPRLSRKVSMLFNALTNRKSISGQSTPTKNPTTSTTSQSITETTPPAQKIQSTTFDSSSSSSSSSKQIPQPQFEIPTQSQSQENVSLDQQQQQDEQMIALPSSTKVFKRKSNIPIINLSTNVLISISLPVPTQDACRWFMITIANDFTHIFVPAWQNVLTIGKIKNAIAYAKRTNKTMKFSPCNSKLDVYATPNEDNKIFFGPYGKNDMLDLLLCQIYKKQLMRIGDYHRIVNGTKINGPSTTGCWLYFSKKHVQPSTLAATTAATSISECSSILTSPSSSITQSLSTIINNKNDYDDDCIFVDPPIILNDQSIITEQSKPMIHQKSITNIQPLKDFNNVQQQSTIITVNEFDSTRIATPPTAPTTITKIQQLNTSQNSNIQVVHMESIDQNAENNSLINQSNSIIHNTKDFDSDDDCLVINLDACDNSPIKNSENESTKNLNPYSSTSIVQAQTQLKLLLDKPPRDPINMNFNGTEFKQIVNIQPTSIQNMNSSSKPFINISNVESLAMKQNMITSSITINKVESLSSHVSSNLPSGLIISKVNSLSKWNTTAPVNTNQSSQLVIDKVESIAQLPEKQTPPSYTSSNNSSSDVAINNFVKKFVQLNPPINKQPSPTVFTLKKAVTTAIATTTTTAATTATSTVISDNTEPDPFLIIKPKPKIAINVYGRDSKMNSSIRQFDPVSIQSNSKQISFPKLLPIEKLTSNQNATTTTTTSSTTPTTSSSTTPATLSVNSFAKVQSTTNYQESSKKSLLQQSASNKLSINSKESKNNVSSTQQSDAKRLTSRRKSICVPEFSFIKNAIESSIAPSGKPSKISLRRHSIMIPPKRPAPLLLNIKRNVNKLSASLSSKNAPATTTTTTIPQKSTASAPFSDETSKIEKHRNSIAVDTLKMRKLTDNEIECLSNRTTETKKSIHMPPPVRVTSSLLQPKQLTYLQANDPFKIVNQAASNHTFVLPNKVVTKSKLTFQQQQQILKRRSLSGGTTITEKTATTTTTTTNQQCKVPIPSGTAITGTIQLTTNQSQNSNMNQHKTPVSIPIQNPSSNTIQSKLSNSNHTQSINTIQCKVPVSASHHKLSNQPSTTRPMPVLSISSSLKPTQSSNSILASTSCPIIANVQTIPSVKKSVLPPRSSSPITPTIISSSKPIRILAKPSISVSSSYSLLNKSTIITPNLSTMTTTTAATTTIVTTNVITTKKPPVYTTTSSKSMQQSNATVTPSIVAQCSLTIDVSDDEQKSSTGQMAIPKIIHQTTIKTVKATNSVTSSLTASITTPSTSLSKTELSVASSTTTTTTPKMNINGYLISNIVGLGKIPTIRYTNDTYGVHLVALNQLVKSNTIKHVNELLNAHLRQHLYRFVPNNLFVQWRFVSDPSESANYLVQGKNILKPTAVLTTFDIIDLESDFEKLTHLPKRLIDHLLIWKLAQLCMNKTAASKMNGSEILDAAVSHIKTLTHKESKLDNLKTYYNVKVELKNLRLEELKNDINAKQTSGRLTSISDESQAPSTSGQIVASKRKIDPQSNVILINDDSD